MVCKKWGMAISVEKSKVLAVGGGEVTALTCLNESYRRGGLLNFPGTMQVTRFSERSSYLSMYICMYVRT